MIHASFRWARNTHGGAATRDFRRALGSSPFSPLALDCLGSRAGRQSSLWRERQHEHRIEERGTDLPGRGSEASGVSQSMEAG